MSSAATTIGCQAPPRIGTARSSARPIEPTCGAESKVEQTLYCVTGAPSPASARKTGGRCASIQAGPFERATPAMPMTRWPPRRASRSGVGASRNSTVGRPAKAVTSIAADEPVKSSP